MVVSLSSSAQTHQLRFIPIPCDGFTRFQQLIIDHTELAPPNLEHNLRTVNIPSGRRRVGIRAFPIIFCAWDYRSRPTFRRRSQSDVKTPSDSILKQLFTSKETPFNISRFQFVRNPIFLLLNHSHDFEAFRNGFLRHSQ